MQGADTRLSNYERHSRAFGGAIGTIFLSVFGLLWILFALRDLNWLHVAIAVLLSCCIVPLLASSISTIRLTHGPVRGDKAHATQRKRINRVFGLVNALQWTAIFAAAMLLGRFHRINLIVPVIVFIVGAHFLPLAHLFEIPLHYFVGCALMTWAIAAPFIFPANSMEASVALGTGVILWLTSIQLTVNSTRLTQGMNESKA